MEAMKADVTQGLEGIPLITCADNTGARELKVIRVAGYHGTKNPPAEGGDRRQGDRLGHQRVPRRCADRCWRRSSSASGSRSAVRTARGVKFEDNAAVIIDDLDEPRGTEIKGPVAREGRRTIREHRQHRDDDRLI